MVPSASRTLPAAMSLPPTLFSGRRFKKRQSFSNVSFSPKKAWIIPPPPVECSAYLRGSRVLFG